MKKLICAIAIIFASATTLAQSFEKFEKEDDMTKIVLSKGLFSRIGQSEKKLSDEDQKVVSFINRIKSFKMYSTNNESLKAEMKSIAKKFKKSKEFEELMKVNNDGKETQFLVKTGKDDEIKELIMYVEGSGDKDSVVFQLSLS